MKLQLLLLALAACMLAAKAQPTCRAYKAFSQQTNTGMVQDTINVADSFPVGQVKVTNMVLGHPNVSTLQLALLHRATPDAPFTTSELKAAVDTMGAFTPSVALNGDSAGQWVLRIMDALPGSEDRLISLTSWALFLCPATNGGAVTASDGPAVSVDVSKAGVSVSVTKGDNATASDRFFSEDHAKSMLELLHPGVKSAPDGVLGLVVTAKEGARGAMGTSIADVLNLVAKSSALYKDFANKKITDVISTVNALGTGAQGLISNKDGIFTVHDKSLMGFLSNLKAAVVGDTQNKVEAVTQTAGQLRDLTGKVTGDLKSSAGLLMQLVVASLQNLGKVYVTAEGAAKAHVDGAITAKATVLEGLLDKIIAGLSAAESSKLTGPVVDFHLKLDQAALKALGATLDKVDSALKAFPTPSQVITGKMDMLGRLWSALDDGPVISHLAQKVTTARDLLKKATDGNKVVATSGN